MHFFSYAPGDIEHEGSNLYHLIGTYHEYLFAYKKLDNHFAIYCKRIIDAGDWRIFINCKDYFDLKRIHQCSWSLPVAAGIDESKLWIVTSNNENGTNLINVYSFNIPDKAFIKYETIDAPSMHQIFFCSNCFFCYVVPDKIIPSEYSIISWAPQSIKRSDGAESGDDQVETRFMYLRFRIEGEKCTFLKAGLPPLPSNPTKLTSNLGLLAMDECLYAQNDQIKIAKFGETWWFSVESADLIMAEDSELKEWKELAFYQSDNLFECVARENPNNNGCDEINSYTFTIDFDRMSISFTKKHSIYTSKNPKNAIGDLSDIRIVATPNAYFLPCQGKLLTAIQRVMSLSEISYLTFSGAKCIEHKKFAPSQHFVKRMLKWPRNLPIVKYNHKFV